MPLETTSTSQSTTPKPNGNGVKTNMLAELQAQIQAMQAQNAALAAKLAKAEQPRRITAKVSEKGGLSLYGLGPFPVTLYKEQWLRLLDAKQDILEYIAANEASTDPSVPKLKAKGDA